MLKSSRVWSSVEEETGADDDPVNSLREFLNVETRKPSLVFEAPLMVEAVAEVAELPESEALRDVVLSESSSIPRLELE